MTKQTVIFIHGMWNTPVVWENYRPRFEAAGFDTIAVTLRHHNAGKDDTPHPDLGTTSIRDYVDDVVKTINEQDTPPVLIGHSLGSLIAQLAAAKSDVKAVVALTPAPPAGVMAVKPTVLKVFKRVLFTWGHWRKPFFPTFEEIKYGVYNNSTEEEARKQYGGSVWDSGRAIAEIAHWMFDKNKSTKVETDKIKAPVLIIGASLDHITPVSVCRAAAKRYPAGACEYVELPDHAHWVLGEDGWEKIADRCIDWIKSKVEEPTV